MVLRDYPTDFHRSWRVEKPWIRCFQPFARRNPCISQLGSGTRSFLRNLRKREARRREPPYLWAPQALLENLFEVLDQSRSDSRGGSHFGAFPRPSSGLGRRFPRTPISHAARVVSPKCSKTLEKSSPESVTTTTHRFSCDRPHRRDPCFVANRCAKCSKRHPK